jgi:hypothetical protein
MDVDVELQVPVVRFSVYQRISYLVIGSGYNDHHLEAGFFLPTVEFIPLRSGIGIPQRYK